MNEDLMLLDEQIQRHVALLSADLQVQVLNFEEILNV